MRPTRPSGSSSPAKPNRRQQELLFADIASDDCESQREAKNRQSATARPDDARRSAVSKAVLDAKALRRDMATRRRIQKDPEKRARVSQQLENLLKKSEKRPLSEQQRFHVERLRMLLQEDTPQAGQDVRAGQGTKQKNKKKKKKSPAQEAAKLARQGKIRALRRLAQCQLHLLQSKEALSRKEKRKAAKRNRSVAQAAVPKSAAQRPQSASKEKPSCSPRSKCVKRLEVPQDDDDTWGTWTASGREVAVAASEGSRGPRPTATEEIIDDSWAESSAFASEGARNYVTSKRLSQHFEDDDDTWGAWTATTRPLTKDAQPPMASTDESTMVEEVQCIDAELEDNAGVQCIDDELEDNAGCEIQFVSGGSSSSCAGVSSASSGCSSAVQSALPLARPGANYKNQWKAKLRSKLSATPPSGRDTVVARLREALTPEAAQKIAPGCGVDELNDVITEVEKELTVQSLLAEVDALDLATDQCDLAGSAAWGSSELVGETAPEAEPLPVLEDAPAATTADSEASEVQAVEPPKPPSNPLSLFSKSGAKLRPPPTVVSNVPIRLPAALTLKGSVAAAFAPPLRGPPPRLQTLEPAKAIRDQGHDDPPPLRPASKKAMVPRR